MKKLSFLKRKIRLSQKEKINFLDQFSNLLISWIPLTNALKIIIYQTQKKYIKEMLEILLDNINKGKSFGESIVWFPSVFNEFDTSLIEIGEVTGKLWKSLQTLKEKEEKNQEIKTKIIGALLYPSIIIILAIAMIITFMVYVIPKIEEMYKWSNVNLPWLTIFVINISRFLQENIFYIILSFIIIWLCLSFFKNWKKTKIYYDKILIHIPFFGNIIKKNILILFSSSIGILLESGIIINKSLEIGAKITANEYYKKEIGKMIHGISTGKELSFLMGIEDIQSKKQNDYFPIELSSIVRIGEQTGKLSELLINISKKFERELDVLVKNIQTAIEPLVIIFVWGIIGVIIMAILLPFFNMVNVI